MTSRFFVTRSCNCLFFNSVKLPFISVTVCQRNLNDLGNITFQMFFFCVVDLLQCLCDTSLYCSILTLTTIRVRHSARHDSRNIVTLLSNSVLYGTYRYHFNSNDDNDEEV